MCLGTIVKISSVKKKRGKLVSKTSPSTRVVIIKDDSISNKIFKSLVVISASVLAYFTFAFFFPQIQNRLKNLNLSKLSDLKEVDSKSNFDNPEHSCNFFGDSKINLSNNSYDKITLHEVDDIIRSILMVAGLPQNFEIKETTETLFASAYNAPENGKESRWIAFNAHNLASIKSESQTNWSVISILAHEIGHHLIGHSLDNEGSRPDKELEADKYSGNILAKMGATLEEALSVLNLFDLPGSSTHPATYSRVAAVTEGWNDGSIYAKKLIQVPEYEDPGPYFGVGPIIPKDRLEYYKTKVNFQRTLERYKYHMTDWRNRNPEHPMSINQNWTDADKERWIRWYNTKQSTD